jgi:hypothetical protein
MPIKRFLQNASLLLGSSIVLLLIIEIVLRTTHAFDARVSYSQPDSILAYRFVPHAAYYYRQENPKAITGRINNFGWRDVDWTLEKPKGTTRIAIIGDSFVEAFQVEVESTFVKILERELSLQHNTRVEVMNFGRSGFTQTEQLLLLQSDVLKFSPDIVVACLLPANDIEDVRRATAPDLLRPFFIHDPQTHSLILDARFRETSEFRAKVFVDVFKRNSALLSLLAERYTLYRLKRDITAKSAEGANKAEKLAGYMSLCSAHPDSEQAKSYALNKLLIERIAATCSEANVELVLLCFPTDAHLPEREREYVATDSTFNPNFFDDDLARLSSALGIHYLGLQRVFRREYERNRRPLHWKHLNYEGHRITASELSKTLRPLLHKHISNDTL